LRFGGRHIAMQRTSTIAVARSAHPRRGEHEPLVAVLAAACAGIVLDRAMPFSFGAWWLLAAVAWILWWLAWRGGQQRAAAMLTLLSVAAAGAVWHHCHWNLYQARDIGLFAHDGGGPAALEVRATSGPRRVPAPPPDPLRTIATPDRTRLEVEVLAVRDADDWRPARGASTLFVDGHLLGVRAGDRLRVFAQLNANAAPQNPGEFDFSRLARAERQLCQMRSEFPECVTLLSAARGWSWSRAIDALRTAGDAALWRSLSPARAGLASAMFLGSREELDADESQALMETGTIHLLVISGLNVGILASCLFLAMRVLLVPRGWALAVVALATVA
jgi:competence protein ComEC